MATQYSIDNALRALPYLVQRAQMGKTIAYSELTAKIGRHHRAAAHLLCYIRDELCIRRDLPLLTAIVVSKTTGLPGPGWLPDGEAYGLSPAEYRQKSEACRDQVFLWDEWDGLLEELGLSPIPKTDREFDEEGRA